jgi:hypothetical protein
VNKSDFQWLARERVRDAKVLLVARRWASAYYLAGYAVECALKCCIISYLMKTDQFPDKKISEHCWTHDLMRLLDSAGLLATFRADTATDPDLSAIWAFVKDWTEASRYQRKTKTQARKLYQAITDKKHGVLSWIKSHW